MDKQEQDERFKSEEGPCLKRPFCRAQKRDTVSVHLLGLLVLLFVLVLEATTAVAARAKVGSGGGGVVQIRPANTSLRNIEDENGKQQLEISFSSPALPLEVRFHCSPKVARVFLKTGDCGEEGTGGE